MVNAIDILKKYNLKNTKQRVHVLELIAENIFAVSQPELEKSIARKIDRVTLYRILASFEKKGILHKIIAIDGTANYAICHAACNEEKHNDEHVHFNCVKCLKIFCLPIEVPKIDITDGYQTNHFNLNAYGTCKSCSAVIN